MSLDGFVADETDAVPFIFDWYNNGNVVTDNAKSPELTFETTPQSAEHIREDMRNVRSFVCGRRLFDITDGWGGQHPYDVPVFCVTHHPPDDTSRWPNTTFVTDLTEAVEQAKAISEDGWVAIGGGSITSQCLELGLLDEIRVNLTPVLLNRGVRWFDKIGRAAIELDGPTKIIEGDQVVHLYYDVKR